MAKVENDTQSQGERERLLHDANCFLFAAALIHAEGTTEEVPFPHIAAGTCQRMARRLVEMAGGWWR